MDVLEELKGDDAYRYLGVNVSVVFTSGEPIKGELYFVDLQHTQTIILRTRSKVSGEKFFLVRMSAVSAILAPGCRVDRVEDIPRVSHEALMDCLSSIPYSEDENVSKVGHSEGSPPLNYQKPWSVQSPVLKSLMSVSTEVTSQDNKP